MNWIVHLKTLNSDYEAKRYKDMALTLPHVHAVPSRVISPMAQE